LTETGHKQITVIEPAGAPLRLDAAEIWAHRELLFFLTWRDVKIRYKQTAIGIAWVVLQPVLTTAIFTVIFSKLAHFDTRDVPYPLFALTGLMIWLFVQTAVTQASNSFVSNTNLVTKVYFPRMIVPFASTLACVFDLLISLPILALLMIYFGAHVTANLLLAPLFILLAIIQTLAFGTMFSALNVRFRDVKFALPFLLQVWMIASPIFYPTTLLTEKWKYVFAINPLTGIIEGFRSAVFGTPFEWGMIAISSLSVLIIAIAAVFIFRNMEDGFADQI
jgi:lipopolysaccharide transport system permease protein